MATKLLNNWIDFIRDHTYIITLLITTSLVGLMAIQLYLITAEVDIQHRQFDKDIGSVLLDMHHRIEDDEALSNQLIQLFRYRENSPAEQEALEKSLIPEIRELTDSVLLARNLSDLEYEFAFYHRTEDTIALSSSGTARQPDFMHYSIKAGWRIKESLGKGMYRYGLLFYNKDWFLIYKVAPTLIISFVFIGILLGCFLSTLLVLKRQKQLSLLKNDFINNLAHELKTPIFASSVIFKIIRKKLQEPSYQDLDHHLSLLEKENQQLKEKAEKVLELTAFERESLEIHSRKMDVGEIISQKVATYSVLISQENGEISYHAHAQKAEIYADPMHVSNIIDNLLDNAVKYCKGAPQIKIESYNKDDALWLKFSDKGIGIAPKDQGFVFDKFFRVTKGNLHQTKGFGLGLSYVKLMMEAYGGKIKIESKLGEGSAFILSFPLYRSQIANHAH